MAKLYIEPKDNIAEIAKQVAANPNTKVVSSDGTPISAQTLAALTSSTPAAPSQSDIQAAANYYGVPADVIDKGIVDSYKAELYQADQQAANTKALMGSLTPAEKENLAIQNGYQGDYTDTAAIDNYAREVIKTTPLAGMTPEQYATDQQRLATQQAQLVQDEIAKQTANVKASNFAPTGTPAGFDSQEDYNDYTYGGKDFNSEFSPSLTNDQLAIAQQQQAADLVKNTITTPAGTVKPSADTIAKLDTGSVVDNTKINTQGGLTTSPPAALTTGDVNKIATTGGAALTTGDVNKLSTSPPAALSTGDVTALATSPAATSSPNTMGTGSIPALTTADLASWGKTLPQGITADQLTAALKTQQDTLNKSYSDALAGNQTALTSQNEAFLKNWNTSADALKNNILSGVDTKNQAFGVDATKGFMNAFKNFQIPTNQQTGVNLGNYNDNRNAAADQWWSQYVTGRR